MNNSTDLKQSNRTIIPERLTEARNYRGLTMSDLGRLVNLTRQAISAFEKGIDNPSFETISKIASVLGLPVSFFSIANSSDKVSGPIFFRSKKTAKKKDREAEKVRADWLIRAYEFVSENLELPHPNIPDFEISDFENLSFEDIDELADKTRQFFNLGLGPISNITRLLENNGIPVVFSEMKNKIGALSLKTDHSKFIAMTDVNATGVRSRFSLAHELGHQVLHKSVETHFHEDKELFDLVENQADRFASAFLLPSKTFAAEFYSPKLQSLIGLKQRWKVSIAAIAMRAHQLDLINENQKAYIFRQLAPYRRKEPLDDVLLIEEPSYLKTAIRVAHESGLISYAQLRDIMAIPTRELAQFFNVTESTFKSEQTDNIIQFEIRPR